MKRKGVEMFSTYIKLEQLPDELKIAHKIKLDAKVPRYDVTAVAGYYPALNSLKNSKGMICFYLNETRGIIDSPDQRRADRFLMGKDSLNFSSIYLLNDVASPCLIGYGNPNGSKTFSAKKLQNPFFDCKNDGYLFVISADWRTIEILVIPDGKFTILGNCKEFQDGKYNEALQALRQTAKPIFQYQAKNL